MDPAAYLLLEGSAFTVPVNPVAFRILATSNIFPLKDFDTWEVTATKTNPALKTFFQEAYGWRLTAIELCSTTGHNGYTNNTL